MSSEYLDLVKPTYIENWPLAVRRLSYADVDIPLSLSEAMSLQGSIIEYGQHPVVIDECDRIKDAMQSAIEKMPHGGFVRLGSRSPKDSWAAMRAEYRATSGDDAWNYLTDCSERISDDLNLAIASYYEPHVFVRQWVKIAKHEEFRCFMKAGKLVGISQYNYFDRFPELIDKGAVKWAIEQFFHTHFRPAWNGDDVIFDVQYKGDKQVTPTGMTITNSQVKLIEVNPFFELTDPCLFGWRSADVFDGSIRIVE